MLSGDAVLESQLNVVDVYNSDWLAGALGGLSVGIVREDEDWHWESFVSWILERAAELNIQTPLFPSPMTTDASMLDVLGGYLSTAASITGGGLFVRMHSKGDLLGLMRLLRISLILLDNAVLVPPGPLSRLLRYVTVRGPLEMEIMESGVIDDA